MESCYKQTVWILKRIENELTSRSSRSEWISCPSFLPVMQSLVSPSKETRRSCHSKYHSKQRKSHSSSSVKNCVYVSSGEDSRSCSRGGFVVGKSESGECGVSSSSPYVKQEHGVNSLSPYMKQEYGVSSSSPYVKQEYGVNSSSPYVKQEHGVNSSSPYVKRESEMESSTPIVSSPSVCEGELSSGWSRKHPPVSSLHYVSPPLAYCRAIEVIIRVGSSGIHTEGELIRCCEEYMKKESVRMSEVGDWYGMK